MTSEKNSYGVTNERWFDGTVEYPSCDIWNFDDQNGGCEINILEVTQYQNLPSACSHDSYYECLAKRFETLDTKSFWQSKGFNCAFQEKCMPFLLPLRYTIPDCKNDTERVCSEDAIKTLVDNQENHCKKSCLVTEYKTEQTEIKPDEKNTMKVRYWFGDGVPISGYGHLDHLLKYVKKEYLIISPMALVGNVGGILGLFVGFSFISAYESLMDAGCRIITTLFTKPSK